MRRVSSNETRLTINNDLYRQKVMANNGAMPSLESC